jgi:integrase
LEKVKALFAASRGGFLDALYHQLKGTTPARRTLKASLTDWLEDARANTAAVTSERYTTIAGHLEEYLKATDDGPQLGEVTPDLMRKFLNARPTNPRTVAFEKKVLSSFFRFCVVNQWIQANPLESIRRNVRRDRQQPDKARRPFTMEELRLLHTKAPSDFWRYMVVAGFFTGQRMGDLISLTWASVDLPGRTIHLKQNKTGVTVHVPMAPELERMLVELRRKSPTATGPLWPVEAIRYAEHGSKAFSPEFYDLLAACGLVTPREDKKSRGIGRSGKRIVTPVSFHCLRHSFVSMLKLSGSGQAVAKELAGHGSDLISDAYTHLPADVLSDAVNKLPSITP